MEAILLKGDALRPGSVKREIERREAGFEGREGVTWGGELFDGDGGGTFERALKGTLLLSL